MSQAQEIFNNLRIPDAVKDIQTFDGNPKFLPNFIKNVEEILLLVGNTDNTPCGQVILRAIRNKIVGQANEALNDHLTPLNWDEIKEVLTDLYTDKRDESTLISELHTVKQFNGTTRDFYNKIIEIQSILLNNLRMRETNPSILSAQKTLYRNLSLNAFLTGLREPLGATIRAMRPSDLTTALTLCEREETIFNTKPYTYNQTYNRRNYYPNQNSYNIQRNNRDIVPYNKRPYLNPQNQQPGRYFNHIYGQPNNKSYNNTRYNRQIPQIKDSNSTMTRHNTATSRNNMYQQNKQFRRNELQAGELNNINNQPQEPIQTQTICNVDDNQNFRGIASNFRSDT